MLKRDAVHYRQTFRRNVAPKRETYALTDRDTVRENNDMMDDSEVTRLQGLRPEHGMWLSLLRGYLLWTIVAHPVWEIGQLPLYTIWTDETPANNVFAVIHCTGGDIIIAGAALASRLWLRGQSPSGWCYRRWVSGFVAAAGTSDDAMRIDSLKYLLLLRFFFSSSMFSSSIVEL